MAYKLRPPDCRENAPNRIWNSKNFQGVIPPDLRPGLRKCKGGNPKTARARARTQHTHTRQKQYRVTSVFVFLTELSVLLDLRQPDLSYRRFVQFGSGTNAHCESFPLTVLYSPYLLNWLLGWRRGSVVRASVSDWRTFPDMCLIYG